MLWLRIVLVGVSFFALSVLVLVINPDAEWNGGSLATPDEWAFFAFMFAMGVAATLMAVGFVGALAAWLAERLAPTARPN